MRFSWTPDEETGCLLLSAAGLPCLNAQCPLVALQPAVNFDSLPNFNLTSFPKLS